MARGERKKKKELPGWVRVFRTRITVNTRAEIVMANVKREENSYMIERERRRSRESCD